ncbi:MAG: DUF6599 family protein [Candidatus Aminicenantia bacterium]
MKKRAIIISIAILILAISLKSGAIMSSKEKVNLKNFIPKEIYGWKAKEKDHFYDQQSIFDYIDGSGEVYCSYNFRTLLVREFKKPSQPPLIVDFFDMGSSEDAFGVFTHDYQDQEIGIGQGSSYLAGSLSFWKSRYFVSIWAEQETELIKRAVLDLGKAIAQAIPEEGPLSELLNYLPQKNLIKKSIRYFHNHFTLNYHYFVANENILNLNQETKAVLAEYEFDKLRSYLLIVRYPSSQEAKEAINNFIRNYLPEVSKEQTIQIENGRWISVKFKKDIVIIFFDAPTKPIAEKLVKEVENNSSKEGGE